MRNIIAHEYGTVDHEIVWVVVDARPSPLAARLAVLLEA
ncbi:HepT-like ribonuclease domain-containing protein [Pseudoglutamicibacter cumminsii]